MVAMELVKNGDPHQPDADLTKALTKRAAEKGLVLLSCGLYGNVIRFLVPLTASDAIVREGLGIVAESLRELTARIAQVGGEFVRHGAVPHPVAAPARTQPDEASSLPSPE